MPPLVTHRPSPAGARNDACRRVLAAAAVALGVVVLLTGLAFVVRGPRFVAHVRVTNPTPYLVDVAVTNGAHGGWTLLGAVAPGERIDVSDVVDAGSSWVFRFDSGPTSGGEITVSRTRLGQDGWTVRVPDAVQTRLARAGAVTFAG